MYKKIGLFNFVKLKQFQIISMIKCDLLFQVANEIKSQLESDPGLGQKLVLARKNLLGVMPSLHR